MSKQSKWLRPKEEIEAALQDQAEFLRSSCGAYDAGHYREAARLASAIFILVHDGGQRSLLTQLCLRAKLRFRSYAGPSQPGNLLNDQPFVMMQMSNSGAENVPVLDQGPQQLNMVQFHQWWEKEIVFRSPRGHSLNRRRITFSMRNQDGGGHVDPAFSDESYVEFSRGKAGWIYSNNFGETARIEPREHVVTIRHIAFELIKSLEDANIIQPERVLRKADVI